MAEAEAQFTLEFPYRRSLGPVVGAFFTALRDKKVLASRTKTGKVICPPLEYDPDSGEAVDDELVEISAVGSVENFAWVGEPMRKHPLDRPFAWVLVKLDGADTTLLHALDAPREAVVRGLRVQVRWRGERIGHITDIECFEVAS
jgi:uncharacterized protein